MLCTNVRTLRTVFGLLPALSILSARASISWRLDRGDGRVIETRHDVDALHRLAALEIGLASALHRELATQRVAGVLDRDAPSYLRAADWPPPPRAPCGSPLDLVARKSVCAAGLADGTRPTVQAAAVGRAPATEPGALLDVELPCAIASLRHDLKVIRWRVGSSEPFGRSAREPVPAWPSRRGRALDLLHPALDRLASIANVPAESQMRNLAPTSLRIDPRRRYAESAATSSAVRRSSGEAAGAVNAAGADDEVLTGFPRFQDCGQLLSPKGGGRRGR